MSPVLTDVLHHRLRGHPKGPEMLHDMQPITFLYGMHQPWQGLRPTPSLDSDPLLHSSRNVSAAFLCFLRKFLGRTFFAIPRTMCPSTSLAAALCRLTSALIPASMRCTMHEPPHIATRLLLPPTKHSRSAVAVLQAQASQTRTQLFRVIPAQPTGQTGTTAARHGSLPPPPRPLRSPPPAHRRLHHPAHPRRPSQLALTSPPLPQSKILPEIMAVARVRRRTTTAFLRIKSEMRF